MSIPNTFQTQSGNVPASQIDTNNTTIRDYVNNREMAAGAIASRPAAGISGRLYLATDVNGGTIFLDNGSSWVQGGINLAAGTGITLTPTGATLEIASTAAAATTGVLLAAVSGTDASTGGGSSSATMLTMTLDGGSLASDNRARLNFNARAGLNAGVLILGVFYGGQVVINNSFTNVHAADDPMWFEVCLNGHGATNQQTCYVRVQWGTELVTLRDVATVDSTANQTLTVTMQYTAGSAVNTLVKESSSVERLKA